MSILHSLMLIFLAVAVSGITGCGGGGGGGSSDSGGGTSVVISGIASKGLISGGTVKISSLNTDGATGSQLGTATTQSGAFSVSIGVYSGNILVEVTGGTYKDEATGYTVSNTTTLRAAILDVTVDRSIAVTPLTEIAVQKAGTLTSSNVEAANTLASNMIGGVDITSTLPVEVTSASSAAATQAQKDYSLMLAAISEMVKDGYAADVASAITAIKNDLSDNQLDSTGSNISAALSTFITSANNQSGVDSSGTQLDNYITTYTNSAIPTGGSLWDQLVWDQSNWG